MYNLMQDNLYNTKLRAFLSSSTIKGCLTRVLLFLLNSLANDWFSMKLGRTVRLQL